MCNFITCSFIKKKLQYRCFLGIFAKFFRVIFNPQLAWWLATCARKPKVPGSSLTLLSRELWIFVKENPDRKKKKIRSTRPEVFCKKAVPNSFAKITGKYLCQCPFFNKVEGLRPTTLFKNRLWHRCFPLNFVKFITAALLQNTCKWLLREFGSFL